MGRRGTALVRDRKVRVGTTIVAIRFDLAETDVTGSEILFDSARRIFVLILGEKHRVTMRRKITLNLIVVGFTSMIHRKRKGVRF